MFIRLRPGVGGQVLWLHPLTCSSLLPLPPAVALRERLGIDERCLMTDDRGRSKRPENVECRGLERKGTGSGGGRRERSFVGEGVGVGAVEGVDAEVDVERRPVQVGVVE